MTFANRAGIAIAAVVCATAAANVALGAGEPKNQQPFIHAATPLTAPAGLGTATPDVAGEPKNDAPFIRDVYRTPVTVQAGDGFDWGDAGIGAAVVFGLGCAVLGALAVRAGTGRRPRPAA